jgi:hypothetical protein
VFGPDHHSAKKATIQPTKVNIDHEIMETGLFCSNVIEKSHHVISAGSKIQIKPGGKC